MATDRAISEPFEETARQRAEVDALLRMLTASEGTSSLSIAICNSPALRNYIIEKVKADKFAIELVDITEEVEDIFDFVRHKVNNDKPAGIFIVDVEKVLPSGRSDYKILRTLNATRELWRSHFHCPLIFWVPEYAATLLSIHARDFWSWLSHTFEFVSEQATAEAGAGDLYAGNITMAGSLDADQKQFRIAELEQRIEDAGDPPKSEIIQHLLIWLNELAYIYFCIGELDQAGRIIHKSLDIKETLGRFEKMAGNYGNLGLIYKTKGDLDKAEEMFRKALEIDEKLGRLEGVARQYGNLGLVYQTKGDLDKAEEMLRKGLEIDEKLGRLEGVARHYGNLGVIYRTKGDLDKAEGMFRKGLDIDEKLGRLEGIASKYGNLGSLYKQRGQIDEAREYWTKAVALYTKIGIPDMVKKVQTWIDKS